MIRACFTKDHKGLAALDISGHADFADPGEDIVCAGVTSAVQLTANGVTEVLGVPATVQVEGNRIRIRLPENSPPAARQMMEALYLQLDVLRQQYPKNIQLTASEV